MTAAKASSTDAPMRLYALAKELSLPSKELLAQLQEQGYSYTSIQNNIVPEDAEAIRQNLTGSGPATKKKATKKKATKKKATKKATKSEAEEEAPPTTAKSKRPRRTKKAAEEEEAPATKKKATKKKATKKKATKKKATKAPKPVEEVPVEELQAEVILPEVEVPVAEAPVEGATPEAFAQGFLQAFLHTMQMDGKVTIEESDTGTAYVQLVSPELLDLSNSKKLTDAIHQILQTSVGYHFDKGHTLHISWQKQVGEARRTIEEMAATLAHRLAQMDKVLYIDSLNPHERRMIHQSISSQEDAPVHTASDGEGIFRRLMVIPNSKQTPQSRGRDDHRGGRDDRERRGGTDDRGRRGGRDDRDGQRDDRGGRGERRSRRDDRSRSDDRSDRGERGERGERGGRSDRSESRSSRSGRRGGRRSRRR